MEKLLYISDTKLKDKSGHGMMINMHYSILKSLFVDNMYSIFMNEENDEIEKKIIHVKQSKAFDKAISIISGYPPFISVSLVHFILELCEKEQFKYVFIENSVSGQLIKKIISILPNITVISYFPDIEAVLMKKELKEKRLLRKISLIQMIRNERLTIRFSTKCFVLNSRDALLMQREYERSPDEIIPCIVPIPSIEDKNFIHHKNQPLTILFVGKNYWPNIQGVSWFIQKVIPHLNIDYEFNIVGFGMEEYKKSFEICKNIHVIGAVENLSCTYNDADVVIAPIFDGGGMKVKTAEALSFGKIFIGMPESLTGYWDEMPLILKEKKVFRAKNENEFSDILTCLYYSDFRKFNVDIYDYAKNNFSKEAVTNQFINMFDCGRKNE